MESRKQSDSIFNRIINIEWTSSDTVAEIIRDYERLNEKCDQIISKIKDRKQKKNKI